MLLEYSSSSLTDTAQSIYPQSWLVKGHSFTNVGFDIKGRSNSLTKNYRTTTQIAEAAYSLLENDAHITKDENFVKPSLLDKQGVYPVFRAFQNKQVEINYVVNLIGELSKNYNYGDIAVIARTNEQVKALTMHSIKGLEFKVVIMISLNNKMIPLKSFTIDVDDKFETRERKLMYVGMTRATEKLYMTCDGTPSKFINDINPRFLKYNENTLISNFYIVQPDHYSFREKIKDIYSHEEKVRQWLPGNDEYHMVRVKGDSMKNANINNGDIVVIRKQNTANNYDIVAVELDGNTTLKRFVRMGGTILLMPENPDYEPINVTETQMDILGLAVGLIKTR